MQKIYSSKLCVKKKRALHPENAFSALCRNTAAVWLAVGCIRRETLTMKCTKSLKKRNCIML